MWARPTAQRAYKSVVKAAKCSSCPLQAKLICVIIHYFILNY